MLNSGLIHRVGPYRLSVKVARRVALEGFLSVRFDLTGVGDSGARRDSSSVGARAVADTRAVMIHAGCSKKTLLLGHSMGGKAAMMLALRHPELVRKLVVMDIAPYAYSHSQTALIDAMERYEAHEPLVGAARRASCRHPGALPERDQFGAHRPLELRAVRGRLQPLLDRRQRQVDRRVTLIRRRGGSRYVGHGFCVLARFVAPAHDL